MPNTDAMPIARKVLPIIYVIDTSGSMKGEKIAQVNEAMHDTLEILHEVSRDNADAEIKIGAMTFSTGTQWVYPSLISLEEDFFWNDVSAGGLTDLGDALKELYDKLSHSSMLVSSTGFCVPAIIFMSDGEPTDENWEKELDYINKNNKWFKHATKIAIAIGADADMNALGKVVGNSEAVIQVTDKGILKKLIKVMSVTTSMINSKSRNSGDSDNATDIINQTLREMNPNANNNVFNVAPETKTDKKNDAGSDDDWTDGDDSSIWS